MEWLVWGSGTPTRIEADLLFLGSPDDKTMYVTDSTSRGIFAYDYDADAGRISNKRFFFKLSDADEGVMDGCAIDTEGNIWAAVHWGSRILKISPKGEALLQITLPAWKPSCPAFGGASMNELFITTAAIEEGETAPLESGQHGSLFRVTVNATGLTRNKFGAATARLN